MALAGLGVRKTGVDLRGAVGAGEQRAEGGGRRADWRWTTQRFTTGGETEGLPGPRLAPASSAGSGLGAGRWARAVGGQARREETRREGMTGGGGETMRQAREEPGEGRSRTGGGAGAGGGRRGMRRGEEKRKPSSPAAADGPNLGASSHPRVPAVAAGFNCTRSHRGGLAGSAARPRPRDAGRPRRQWAAAGAGPGSAGGAKPPWPGPTSPSLEPSRAGAPGGRGCGFRHVAWRSGPLAAAHVRQSPPALGALPETCIAAGEEGGAV